MVFFVIVFFTTINLFDFDTIMFDSILFVKVNKCFLYPTLSRSLSNKKMVDFFKHNFEEDRWRKAALKNAFDLLGRQRFTHAAAFFLLAGSLHDAVEVTVYI